jgi:hypothetical protein
MPAATLTWTASAQSAVAIAGASSTVAELIVGIKALIDASTWWETSDYSAGNGTLEIKRRVSTSPTGEAATVRYLIFGGQTPNAAALLTGVTANTTTLYASGSVNANTTGPSASYAAAAPYATKYIQGMPICTGTALQAAETPRCSIIESEEGLGIWLGDTNTWTTVILGKLILLTDDTTCQWAVIPTGQASSVVAQTNSWTENSANAPLPSLYVSAATPTATYWSDSFNACRRTGRLFIGGVGSSAVMFGANGQTSTLIAIPVGDAQLATGGTISLLGYFRQLRWGPSALHAQTMRNAGGTVVAYNFGPPVGLTGYGCWFDQTP